MLSSTRDPREQSLSERFPFGEQDFSSKLESRGFVPFKERHFRTQPANGDLVERCASFYGGADRHLEYYLLFMLDPNFMYRLYQRYKFMYPRSLREYISFSGFF
jgi:hypothetical protein